MHESTHFFSARAYHYILKLSRTIADLAGSEEIEPLSGEGAAIPSEDHDVNNKARIPTLTMMVSTCRAVLG